MKSTLERLGIGVTDLAECADVSRQTIYNWMRDYEAGEKIPAEAEELFNFMKNCENLTKSRLKLYIDDKFKRYRNESEQDAPQSELSEELIQVLKKVADSGDPDSEFIYAKAIQRTDPELAKKYYEKAMKSGQKDAGKKLFELHYNVDLHTALQILPDIIRNDPPGAEVFLSRYVQYCEDELLDKIELAINDAHGLDGSKNRALFYYHVYMAKKENSEFRASSPRHMLDGETYRHRAECELKLIRKAMKDGKYETNDEWWGGYLKNLGFVGDDSDPSDLDIMNYHYYRPISERKPGLFNKYVSGSKEYKKYNKAISSGDANAIMELLDYLNNHDPVSEDVIDLWERTEGILLKRLGVQTTSVANSVHINLDHDDIRNIGNSLLVMGGDFHFLARAALHYCALEMDPECMYNLGKMIDESLGEREIMVSEADNYYPKIIKIGSEKSACEWFMDAATLGNMDAIEMLKRKIEEGNLDAQRFREREELK